MIQWSKQLRIAFGASFLWLVCLIYFTQGFRSFVWTAVSYQLKDKLQLSPSASQFVTSIVFFPWSIKPLYGILSDCVPIRGRKRIPYLVIATLLSLFPWVFLSFNSTMRNLRVPLMILLTVQNLGTAIADVVIDVMIAEAVRFERWAFIKHLLLPYAAKGNCTDFQGLQVILYLLCTLTNVLQLPLNRASCAGDLQSISWMAMALGGICGSLFGGYALTNFGIDKIFLLFSAFPAVQLLSCGLVEESFVTYKVSSENLISNGDSHSLNGRGSREDTFSEKSKSKTLRRKRSRKSIERGPVDAIKIQALEPRGSLPTKWFHSLKIASYTLFDAFRRPSILRPMAWFFLAHVTVPNLSTIMFYYQTEILKLEASFLGTARVVGWLGLMLGTFIYNRYLKKMKLRRILLFAHIGLSIMSILDGVLVSRLNLSLGISDKVMVLFGSALSDGINQFKFMPFLILSGQLCPPGIEGTLFALFMSINNFGSTVGSFVGAGLALVLDVSSGNFDNLLLSIVVQAACTFIPVAVLFLLPKEATGIST